MYNESKELNILRFIPFDLLCLVCDLNGCYK